MGERGIGPLDRADQRIDHLVLDPVLQVARGDGAGEAAPAVVDLLVLEQRIEDMREEPLVFPEHRGERRGRRPAHAGIGIGEPVERLLHGEPAVAEREAKRGQRLVEQPRPGRRAGHIAVEQQALHVLGKLVGAEGPALLQPGAVAGKAPALLQPAGEKVVVDLVELELEEDGVRGNLREALLDGLVETPGLRGRHVARARRPA